MLSLLLPPPLAGPTLLGALVLASAGPRKKKKGAVWQSSRGGSLQIAALVPSGGGEWGGTGAAWELLESPH